MVAAVAILELLKPKTFNVSILVDTLASGVLAVRLQFLMKKN
jgi:hypothetical protein